MGNLIADIFVTVKDRYALATRSLSSLLDNTDRSQFRLTVCVDGAFKHSEDDYGLPSKLGDMQELRFMLERNADYVLHSRANEGLGPTINRALSHIDALKQWDDASVPLTVYCQDDLVYSKNWLERLAGPYLQLKEQLKLGFATGAACPEHEKTIRRVFPNGIVLQDWIRATNLMADHRYWMSMWPISKIDPETGRLRGKPSNGMGSSVDWWFIRNHQNSVCRTGRTNLVVPGLILHDGYDQSTWLKSNLPETPDDLTRIHETRTELVKP